MPEMDGAETARRIEALPLDIRPTIIMITAHGREEVLASSRRAGATEVLLKPCTPSHLYNAAIRAIQMHDTQTTGDATPVSGPRPARMATAGTTVLLVEDNLLNQIVARGMLEEIGLTVELAENGALALDMIFANHPEYFAAVLMDIQMPVMDGIEASVAIRRDARFSRLPIVAMTANALQSDREKCAAAGTNAHVPKPISTELLVSTLSQWIEFHSVENSADALAKFELVLSQGISGLAPELGLRRAGGHIVDYLGALRRAPGEFKSAIQELQHAIATGNRPLASRSARSFRLLSASLGAQEMTDLVAKLELGVNSDERALILNAYISELTVVLARFASGVRDALQDPDSQTPDVVEASPLALAMRELAQVLDENDANAGSVLAEREHLLRGPLGEHFAAIKSATEMFEFPEALDRLRRAAHGLGIAL
jgi:two-component system sensor histidine kinase/response regulator